MIRRLGMLAGGIVLFWALLAALIWQLWDRLLEAGSVPPRDVALTFSAVAALLCLIPAVGTLLWSVWGQTVSPEQQLYAALGGTGVRMFFVLGVGMLLTNFVAYFQQPGFWMWVLAFYLFTLILEVVLITRGQQAGLSGGQPQQPARTVGG